MRKHYLVVLASVLLMGKTCEVDVTDPKVAAALDHSRTREQWRRYQFMVERSRAFVEVGGNSLRAFLE